MPRWWRKRKKELERQSNMVLVPEHLWIAIKEIGISEFAGEANNPRIAEYLYTVDKPGVDEIPWCSAFINWVMHQIGINGTGDALARSWLTWSMPEMEPARIGSVVILKRGREAWMGHVGLYISKNTEDGFIYVLSGNQKNRVSIEPYNLFDVLSYRWHSRFDDDGD